jgi:hypothetical protein
MKTAVWPRAVLELERDIAWLDFENALAAHDQDATEEAAARWWSARQALRAAILEEQT